MFKKYLLLFFVLMFFGCSSLGTYNPATGKNEIVFLSTNAEISMGKELHDKLLQQYKLSDNSAEVLRLQNIGQKVAKVSDRQDYQYNFYLIEDKALNAFTVPGGNIYMHSGLMEKLTSDDEIAAVLAHEIGHCAAKHTAKKYQASLGYGILGSVGSAILGKFAPGFQQVASMSSDAVMNLVFSAYSRKDEYEADKLAVKYLRLAGYDPNAFVQVLELLKKESKGSEGLLLLRSHPYLDDRIKNVEDEISLKSL